MKPKTNRYAVSGLPEAQFEPGSRGLVLKNLLGINRKADMDRTEEEALQKATEYVLKKTSKDQRFTAKTICNMHKVWLKGIYPWAGQYRKVNISKAGFMFAVADHIPTLMKDFERSVLHACTPCSSGDIEEIVRKIASVHVELVLIHPFREGNGRIARLLATLMALQADLPLLNFQAILGNSMPVYFSAVQAGMKRDYKPMESVIKSVIKKTLKRPS